MQGETMQPLVSIIVPLYNAAPHLARCLESIRRQKYKNLEIIVVNDGSDDASMKILDMYAGVDKRIVAIDKENRGVSATRNLAIGLAKGDYLQFVDSDDFLDENATFLLVQKALECSADMVISHYCHVNNGKVTVHGFISEYRKMLKSKFAVQLMEEPASFYYGVMWNKLYKASIIHENNIFCDEEFSWSEDFLFNLAFIRHAEVFVALKTPVYYYVYNANSILHSHINPVKIVKGKMGLFKYYKRLYEDLGLYEQNKAQIYKYLVSLAEHT